MRIELEVDRQVAKRGRSSNRDVRLKLDKDM